MVKKDLNDFAAHFEASSFFESEDDRDRSAEYLRYANHVVFIPVSLIFFHLERVRRSA